MWSWIFNYRFGAINQFLASLGIEGPDWIGDERWALISLSIMSLWGLGGGIIFYLAGLQTVPRHLHEAAKIAGAGWWRRLFVYYYPTFHEPHPSFFVAY